MSSTVVNLKYPRPPRMKIDAKLFKCPCCCQALPAELAENGRWKKHLADDIVPYTCVLQNCATPEVLFPTKETWRRHLLEEHHSYEYWTCSICRERIELPDEESFIWHTKARHADSINQDRIPVLAGLSRRSSPTEMKSCPICGWSQTEGAKADKESLVEHVAKEVHAFSLRSLPWADEPEYAADNLRKEDHENITNWLKKLEHTEEPYSLDLVESFGKPLSEPVIPQVGYFQRNLYFADSSSASSTEHTSAATRDHSIADHQNTSEGSLSTKSNLSRHSTSSVTNQQLSTVQVDEDWTDMTDDDEHINKVRRSGRCRARECDRKQVYGMIGDVKFTSLYCHEHTCQGPCDALKGFCSTPRSHTDKFCPQHGKCSRSGCILLAPREGVSCHDFPWTCPRHAAELLLEAGEDRSRYPQLLTEEEDRRAHAAAEGERARLAQEDDDARRRAADHMLVDDVKGERGGQMEGKNTRKKDESKRRQEDEERRLLEDSLRRHLEMRRTN